MTRIVLDPGELDRFAGFAAEAADDHAARAARFRSMELPEMPADAAALAGEGLSRIADDLDRLATTLYAEALMLRSRAGLLDPAVRPYLAASLRALPG